ncbi:hypothetical protein [Yoonia sp. R2-816]|uniref:hypothetical protein n=1 Tax=Yoonia sp. R2-816 TaxID=3342638 RepID=UPI00372807A2
MDEFKRLTKDETNAIYRRIYAYVGEIVCEWNEVEGEMGKIFQMCMNPDPRYPAALPFWTIQGFRGMLDATGAAVKALCFKEAKLIEEWTEIRSKLEKANKIRNKIAHGGIWHELPRDRDQNANDIFLTTSGEKQQDNHYAEVRGEPGAKRYPTPESKMRVYDLAAIPTMIRERTTELKIFHESIWVTFEATYFNLDRR